jgi:RP/EB family microtubule-associated protein
MAGIMDPHYFLSKADLLGWINETLSLRLSKVEDTANGAVACQIMDALHPGMVPFKKLVRVSVRAL